MTYNDNVREGVTPLRPGTASALPLLGVFIGGLIAAGGMLEALVSKAPDMFPFKLAAGATAFTLPLTLYAVLYAHYLIRARGGQARMPFGLSVLTYVVLIGATLLGFPIVMYAAVMGFTPIIGFGAAFVVPAVAGMIYGVFLSAVFGTLTEGKWPHRFRAHVLSGGVVGLLVFFLYVPFGVGPALNASNDIAVEGIVFAFWSAVLLTLCYVPHALATRPWQVR